MTPWRRDYIRELQLTVNVPDYDDKLSKEYETNAERATNTAIAASEMKRLFTILGAWGVDENLELKLYLTFMSPGERLGEKAGR